MLFDSVFKVSIIPKGGGGNFYFRASWGGTPSQEISARPGRISLVKEEIPGKMEEQEGKGMGKEVADKFLESPFCEVCEGSQLSHCPLENTQGQGPSWKNFCSSHKWYKIKSNISKTLLELS